MRVLNISHRGCMDGLVSAWLVRKTFPDATTVLAHAGGPLPLLPEVDFDLVLVTDISFTEEEMEGLVETYGEGKVVLLDHHDTAIKRFQYTDFAPYLSYTMSGALITYHYLMDHYPEVDLLPYFDVVNYTSDRDLWAFRLDSSRAFSAYMFHNIPLDDSEKGFEALDLLTATPSATIIQTGQAIDEVNARAVAKAVDRAVWTSFAGYHNVPVVNVDYTLASDVGNALAKRAWEQNQNKDFGADFAVCWSVDSDDWGNAVVKVSLRAVTDSEQCLDFATSHGGGGHKRSCGVRFTPSKWFKLLSHETGSEYG